MGALRWHAWRPRVRLLLLLHGRWLLPLRWAAAGHRAKNAACRQLRQSRTNVWQGGCRLALLLVLLLLLLLCCGGLLPKHRLRARLLHGRLLHGRLLLLLCLLLLCLLRLHGGCFL